MKAALLSPPNRAGVAGVQPAIAVDPPFACLRGTIGADHHTVAARADFSRRANGMSKPAIARRRCVCVLRFSFKESRA